MADAVVLENIHKRFPKISGYKDIALFWRRSNIFALNGVSMAVPAGGAFGILGPNGAGKTTLLKILTGLVLPNAGTVTIGGIDVTGHPERIRQKLMYVTGEERTLFWRLTGRQNLKFYASLFEIPRSQNRRRVDEVLAIVNLEEFADVPVMKYSTGMKHRLAIARGLLSNPDILLLDEPTRSLDPLSARRLWAFIKDVLINELGRTVLIATHNMEEASYLCSRVAILDKGVIKASDTIDRVGQQLINRSLYHIELDTLPADAVVKIQRVNGVHDVSLAPPNGRPDSTLELSVDDPKAHIPQVVELIVQSGGRVTHVSRQQRSLTDVILAISESSN